MFVRKLFYLAWRGNGVVDFDEILHVVSLWVLIILWGKLAAQTPSLLSFQNL